MTPPNLEAAVRLHLARMTPLQRAAVARGEGSAEARRAAACVTAAEVARELARCRDAGVRIVLDGDPCWPPLLRQMADPPLALWVRGELPCVERLALALVGPRRCSAYGLAMTRRLGSALAEAGVVIVSGGAAGVDGAAHHAALQAGEPTVAVLGCGVDVTYPRAHRELFARIASGGGALVSELPLGSQPLQMHFPIRNRLLAGWTRSVLVVEASLRSGSLITARLALALDRDVMAVPGPVTSPLSEGTNELIARGAKVLRAWEDVHAELRPDERARLREPARGVASDAPDAPSDEVLAALGAGQALAVEDLVEATGMRAGPLLARLVAHEAAGLATSLEGGLWMRSPRARRWLPPR